MSRNCSILRVHEIYNFLFFISFLNFIWIYKMIIQGTRLVAMEAIDLFTDRDFAGTMPIL